MRHSVPLLLLRRKPSVGSLSVSLLDFCLLFKVVSSVRKEKRMSFTSSENSARSSSSTKASRRRLLGWAGSVATGLSVAGVGATLGTQSAFAAARPKGRQRLLPLRQQQQQQQTQPNGVCNPCAYNCNIKTCYYYFACDEDSDGYAPYYIEYTFTKGCQPNCQDDYNSTCSTNCAC